MPCEGSALGPLGRHRSPILLDIVDVGHAISGTHRSGTRPTPNGVTDTPFCKALRNTLSRFTCLQRLLGFRFVQIYAGLKPPATR
jgi:hypothetical protein